MSISDTRILDALHDFAHRRGADKTFCPSEVARVVADDWRPLMDDVRRLADGDPSIEAVQKGEVVKAQAARGPIRLRLAQSR